MINDLCIVLTARMGSSRLPGKAIMEVGGKPLLYWIMRRLRSVGNVVLATTKLNEDNPLVAVAEAAEVPVYRGAVDDVVTRMNCALETYYPQANYVMRGLGDCPFMAGELIARAVEVMRAERADAFCWALAPHSNPVYGAREFPYSRRGWHILQANSTQREHVDMYYHLNREAFQTVYHEPPPNIYFRPYRLEVDWQDDLELIRLMAAKVSMLAPLPVLLKWLDEHSMVAGVNHGRVEKTGPTCYDYQTQRAWFQQMQGKKIIGWDKREWLPPGPEAVPVFCKAGQCLLGLAADGILHAKVGRIAGDAYLNCDCGAGLRWSGPQYK